MTKKMYNLFFLSVLSFVILQNGYAATTSPNIIFILIDDLGYYDLSSYGAEEVNTKNIDQLAAEGVRFTDYYAAAPICSPSRAGLLTGCYPRRVGNHIWVHRPDSESGLNPKELTIAELFRYNGYKTACIGKWHLGFKEPFLPRNQGFDHYFGLLHNLDNYETVHFKDDNGVPLLRNGEVIERPADPATLTRLYTDEAIHWIEEVVSGSGENPFFLYLPHTMLHLPIGVGDGFKGATNWGDYGDAIMELDHHIGRLTDKLEELEISDHTIIIFTSDNGRGPGRNQEQPLRGSKLNTWEAGIRVPSIVRGPGLGIQNGISIKEVTYAMDWYPTLASLAGIKIPEDIVLDGRDLSEMLLGEADEIVITQNDGSLNSSVPLRRYWNPPFEWSRTVSRIEYLNAFFYHGSQGALSAVRSGQWKLYLNPELTLYNLESDPGENNPVDNWKVKGKLRGMAVMFQEEMRTCARPAGVVWE